MDNRVVLKIWMNKRIIECINGYWHEHRYHKWFHDSWVKWFFDFFLETQTIIYIILFNLMLKIETALVCHRLPYQCWYLFDIAKACHTVVKYFVNLFRINKLTLFATVSNSCSFISLAFRQKSESWHPADTPWIFLVW